MKPIPDAYKKVPMMFRAQVQGRSQLQYLDSKRKKEGDPQDVEIWTDEWVDKAEFISELDAEDIQTDTYGAKSYKISWRFVTNGGQDDGMLRPVLGALGIPFYPGSSMKGAFRHACQQAESTGEILKGTCSIYCGDEDAITPGSLRFLGAYPTNDWTQGLLDLVHPQQEWQVKTRETASKPSGESPYAQVSLYQPTLRFAISSAQSLSNEQWEQIWKIWERAIAAGLGSKVSNGYGQVSHLSSPSIVYRARVRGQGQASKLIDDTGEFRHNIFRAALRGHALRIFGGITDKGTAQQLVDELFGEIKGKKPTIGLLGLHFQELKLEANLFGSGKYAQSAYQVDGEITWFLTRSLSNPDQKTALRKLVAKLMQFAMVFGGFGKSWRRVDHRNFFEEYYEDSYKALIGCHWQWLGETAKRQNVQVWRLEKVSTFINSVLQASQGWMLACNKRPQPNNWTKDWRESWHPSNVQVWGRLANDAEDSVAVRWFHAPYQPREKGLNKEGAICKSSLTGKINQIGRIWHRMYPVILLKNNPEDPRKAIVRPTLTYLEILTIFSDNSDKAQDFLKFLETNPGEFQQLWGDSQL